MKTAALVKLCKLCENVPDKTVSCMLLPDLICTCDSVVDFLPIKFL